MFLCFEHGQLLLCSMAKKDGDLFGSFTDILFFLFWLENGLVQGKDPS